MFSTIQFTPDTVNDAAQLTSPKPARVVKPTRSAPVLACTECRRRKARCDGNQPCQRCKDNGKEGPCIYLTPKPRVIPSQKTVDHLSNSLEQCRSILKLLFPSSDISALQSCSRKELIDLILSASSQPPGGQIESPTLMQPDGSSALEQLQDPPSEFDEDSPDFVTDDVNALDLSALRHSSYVGSSSISAALKVMSILCPAIKKHSNLPQIDSPYERSDRDASDLSSLLITRDIELESVEAYFSHVHVLVPMIDEKQFRMNFASGARVDAPWLSLLNMVFALGSIAAMTCLDTVHTVFFLRAKRYLGLESFGSGRLETIQALALMGGFYLHYCNRPNMAVAITGAALRMACALGIHRETLLHASSEHAQKLDFQNDREVKRRTWWSLVCLDIWGSTTLGRPAACDYFGPAVTVHPPSYESPGNRAFEDRGPYLTASVGFCRLATEIQNRLAISSYLTPSDIAIFDRNLISWFEALPAPLRSPHQCARTLLVPRAVLRWRYQNIRLLLYRPVLLHAGLSRKPFAELSPVDKDAIESCRSIAGNSIIDITTDWQPDHICGWNAVWFLFQASMVPLLSLFYESDNIIEAGKWRGQVEIALRVLQSMELWSAVAKRSREVIAEVYEASNQMSHAIMDGAMNGWDQQSPYVPDDLWNSVMWDQVSQFPEFPFGPTEFGRF